MNTSSRTSTHLIANATDASSRPDLAQVRRIVSDIFESGMHAARVRSMANGVAGLLNASVLSVHAIGQAYASLAKIHPKNGVKQVDRWLGNDGVHLDTLMQLWCKHILGDTTEPNIAIDWTDFDDDHSMLCIYQVTRLGRALPICWKTMRKSQMKKRRTEQELALIETLDRWLAPNTRVTLLADRGFGYQELYELLAILGWDYVIRFRQGVGIHWF